MNAFWKGFEKRADDEVKSRHLRRALLGNPISSAIEAKPGQRGAAFGDAYLHQLGQTAGGAAIGAGAGAATGGGIGAAHGTRHGDRVQTSHGRTSVTQPGRAAARSVGGRGALVGGAAGLLAGSLAGSLRGTHGQKATEIHKKRSKHR